MQLFNGSSRRFDHRGQGTGLVNRKHAQTPRKVPPSALRDNVLPPDGQVGFRRAQVQEHVDYAALKVFKESQTEGPATDMCLKTGTTHESRAKM